jgi:excisionase family DNA binding protein
MENEQRLYVIHSELQQIKDMLTEILAYQQAEMKDSVLDVNELSEMLNLDKHIIYAKCGNGQIPCFKIGKRYKFKKSEIKAWLKNQVVEQQTTTEDYVTRYLQKKVLRT